MSQSTLRREDQTRFWDRQAAYYSDAHMTNDNGGELAIVRMLCAEYVANGSTPCDIVTFGGADGCRDPRVVLDVFASTGIRPAEIYFNDLSSEMVMQARSKYLNTLSDGGISVLTLAGNMADVIDYIPHAPRRVVVGGYHIEAFLRSSEAEGYPLCGLDEYVRSADMLGEHLTLEWCDITKDGYEATGNIFRFNARESQDAALVSTILSSFNGHAIVKTSGALRVIARHAEGGEPFISHWYTDAGFRTLLSTGFGDRVLGLPLHRCVKGIVACIDPVGFRPTGMVTMLNNVIGNILPKDIVRNLAAINSISQ